MKCTACGYEHEGEWTSEGYKNIIGDERFIQIYTNNSVMIENPYPCEHGNYNYQEYFNVSLYSCPKCGTVRMESIDE